MRELEVEAKFKGNTYWGLYKYGSEFTDAPEEREYAVVTILEFGVWNPEGTSICALESLPGDVLDALDEAALQQASENLNLLY